MYCAVTNNSFSSSKCSHFTKLRSSNNALHHNLLSRGWTAQNVSLYHDYQGSFYAGKQKSEYVDKKFWENEIVILKKIGNHQNIVRFFSTCLCNADRFSTIIMELCDGNLEEYVQSLAIIPLSQLSFNDELLSTQARSYFSCKILDILHQTTKGLQYLHENRTIHRAIAPSNVFLNKTNISKTVAKLGGFGYSIQLQGGFNSVVEVPLEIRINHSPLSYWYKASECCTDRGVYSKQSDIFALGILMHYALTGGKYPFKSNAEITERKAPNFKELRSSKFDAKVTEEAIITVVDMTRRMIDHEPTKRLTVDEVLCHPTFYSDQEKLNFLLKVHESVKNWKSTPLDLDKLHHFDGGLLNDNDVGNSKKFQLSETKIFKNHECTFSKKQTKPKTLITKTKKETNGFC